MEKTAISELQQHIEAVGREAFAAGYAAAMKAVREVALRPAPATGMPAPRRQGGAGRKASTPAPVRRRRARANEGAARTRGSVSPRPQRGANAQRVEEILKDLAPRAVRAGEIRQALQDQGVEMSFTSIRHALAQLETRKAAEQVGDSKTWRHRGGAS